MAGGGGGRRRAGCGRFRVGLGVEAPRLNLSPVPAELREQRGLRLALPLKVVLDRTLWVDLEALSDAPGGDPEGSPTSEAPPRQSSRDRV